MKKRAVVICPGRGTYSKETLGYLRTNGHFASQFLRDIDERRHHLNEPTISELDSAERFDPDLHTRGEHASSLIYACAAADFAAIDRDQYDIVAVTGNSMGWYLALAFGGSLDWAGAFRVINTMGSMMKDRLIGGQVIYPLTDTQWRLDPERIRAVDAAVLRAHTQADIEIFSSIFLGGFTVLGANDAGVKALLQELPPIENYPLQLANHAAFHTPLLKGVVGRALDLIKPNIFSTPKIPLIDGRGHVWSPWATDLEALYRYTLGNQVVEPYDFTRAVTVALKEFAPDALILLGPGSNLGGAIGQVLVQNEWQGLKTKSDFTRRQAEAPLVLAMGRPDQRTRLSRVIPTVPSSK